MSDVKEPHDILLIDPPYGLLTNPYISIPLLGAWLKEEGMRVKALDLNAQFYRGLLNSDNIQSGLKHMTTRLRELNEKDQLTFSELNELFHLVSLHLHRDHHEVKKALQEFFLPYSDYRTLQRSPTHSFFIRTATIPFYPNHIHPGTTFTGTTHSVFSTQQLLSLARTETAYTPVFKKILSTHLKGSSPPPVIGISVTFQNQIPAAFQCAALLRDLAPNSHITMGGASISILFRELKNPEIFDFVDSLILDEGERPLKALCDMGRNGTFDLSSLPGALYRKEGHILKNPPPQPIEIEQSPPPDYTLYNLDEYLVPRNELQVPYRLAKGCQWQRCTFCRTDLPFCKDFQTADPEVMYKNLCKMLDESGIRKVVFSDESCDPESLEKISEWMIRDNLNLKWRCHTRVSTQLTQERCALYAQAGCSEIALGIESMSDRILRKMGKGISTGLIDMVLRRIDGVLPLRAYMMLGFPGEREEDALHGFERIQAYISEGLLASYIYSVFTLTNGSAVHRNPEEFGLSDVSASQAWDLPGDLMVMKGDRIPEATLFKMALNFNNHGFKAPGGQSTFTCTTVPTSEGNLKLRYSFKEHQELIQLSQFKSFEDLPEIQNTRAMSIKPTV